MRWLGLDWDEGPEVGGPFAPYRQSERLERYADVAERLLASGHAYRCYCTPDELEQRREADRPRSGRLATTATAATSPPTRWLPIEAEGRTSVVRFRMPERAFTWNDLVRGEVTFPAGEVRDYVLVRANGEPLYTLVNPVDDALMQITHVLRGEDLLSSTPRQLALVGGAPRDRRRHGTDSCVRSPALRDGGGEQEALQARPGVVTALLRRAGVPAGGHRPTTSHCSAGR